LKNAAVICDGSRLGTPVRNSIASFPARFAEIAEFIALTRHLLAPCGVFAAMKGVYPFEEIERLPPDFRCGRCTPSAVPGLEAERHLVLIERA